MKSTVSKSYSISKKVVYEAYKRVKKNDGAAGVDGQTVNDFEKRWEDNLYKLWNRMSSGCYMPKAVRVVKIAKENGKLRSLGIPTVEDRVAQMTVKMELESRMERIFSKSSFGYIQGCSALDAVEIARENCWRQDWVLDLDIKAFFDNIPHDIVMEMVKKHTTPEEKWIVLYIERWLKVPAMDGETEIKRDKGTPQGGVISPLLANLFLHYAFDTWLEEKYAGIKYERYADDIVVHCDSLAEAMRLKDEIKERLKEYKLELNEEKTKIVYCKDDKRNGTHGDVEFDFLGYTFKERSAKSRDGKMGRSFNPAVSKKAIKKMMEKIRAWELHKRVDWTLQELVQYTEAVIRGWHNYYGRYRKSAMYPVLRRIDTALVKWAKRKYKNLHNSWKEAKKYMDGIKGKMRESYVLWQSGVMPRTGW
jgi:RNA-directed DNA polymerase